jgi:hypothetical protein
MFTMEHTNKVADSNPRVTGTWEIVDHRDGKDYKVMVEQQRKSFLRSKCLNFMI